MSEENQPPAKPPRVWFIQKPIAHNCPVGQFGPLESQAAVFQDFMPTVSLQKHEWVPVVERSAYDFWKKRCLDSEDAFKIQAQEYEKVVAELAGAHELVSAMRELVRAMRKVRKTHIADIAKLEQERGALEAKLKVARGALEFYARGYDGTRAVNRDHNGEEFEYSAYEKDDGYTARQALKRDGGADD